MIAEITQIFTLLVLMLISAHDLNYPRKKSAKLIVCTVRASLTMTVGYSVFLLVTLFVTESYVLGCPE